MAVAREKLEFLEGCPICGYTSRKATVRHYFGIYTLVRCSNPICGTDYLNPRAPEAFLTEQYDNPSYYTNKDGIHGYFDYEAEKATIMTTVSAAPETSGALDYGSKIIGGWRRIRVWVYSGGSHGLYSGNG